MDLSFRFRYERPWFGDGGLFVAESRARVNLSDGGLPELGAGRLQKRNRAETMKNVGRGVRLDTDRALPEKSTSWEIYLHGIPDFSNCEGWKLKSPAGASGYEDHS